MTALGEKAVETARSNGIWITKSVSITDEQVEALAEKLVGSSPAYKNFIKMPSSAQRTNTRRYLSFKSEEARQRDFLKIVDMLNKI